MDIIDEKGSLPPQPRSRAQLWVGMGLWDWLRLLAAHRFAVDRGYRAVALKNTLGCAVSSVLGWIQMFRYHRAIVRTSLTAPPLFILGHARSGTTHLHNLLSLDPRHIFPTTYECFMPRHFLISEAYVTRRRPLKGTRDIDNVELRWDTPQEDEFALALLGQPSPLLSFAFPRAMPRYDAYLDLCGLPARARHAWKQTLYRFLQALTYRRAGRVVLKSPMHTGRIRILHELFPKAKFVHIVRNPYKVIPSTLKVYRGALSHLALQHATGEHLEARVFRLYRDTFERVQEGRQLFAPGQFHELLYEDLARDPLGTLATLYEKLGLGGFEEVRPLVESYLGKVSQYRVGRHELSPELQARIADQCSEVIRRYGYQPGPAPQPVAAPA
jgi:omega-hydroxy-beta-dihydromenaquinone-9 sulfotransferase